MEARNLSASTRSQYQLYFEKIETLYSNGLLDQNSVNEFIATYKSSLIKSFLRLYLEYKNINWIKISKNTGRTTRKKPLIMSKDDLEVLLYVLYQYNEKIGLMAELSYLCALRRDEVCNISVGDFDWDEWKKERLSGKLLIVKGKGDKQRYVIVPTEMMHKIKDYINKQEVKLRDKLFFKNKDNKNIPITKERYWEIYHDAVVKLFGKKYKLHTLRHTKATEWFDQGIDIVRIQQRLGHNDISTTRLYINPEEKSELKRWSKEND